MREIASGVILHLSSTQRSAPGGDVKDGRGEKGNRPPVRQRPGALVSPHE
jgi:hypothetical protein